MKTLLSRNSEVKSQVGYSQIRNELIETSPTSHRNLCFEVANSEMRFRAQSPLSGSAARLYRDMKNYYDRSVNACEGNAVASAHFKKHMVQICNEVENMTMKKQAMPSDDPGSAPVMVMVGRGATGQGAAKQGHRKVMTGNSSTK